MKKFSLILLCLFMSHLANSQNHPWEINLASGGANVESSKSGLTAYFISTQLKIPVAKNKISIAPTFSFASAGNSDRVDLFLGDWNSDYSLEIGKSNYGGEIQTSIAVLLNFHFLNGNPDKRFNLNFGIGPSYKSKIGNTWSEANIIRNGMDSGETLESLDIHMGSTIALMARLELNYNLKNNLYLGVNIGAETDDFQGDPLAPMATIGAHIGYKIPSKKKTTSRL